MPSIRLLPALVLTGGLFLAAGSSAQPPQPKAFVSPEPVARDPLPIVPKSSAAFVSVKVSDIADHPDFKQVLDQLKKTPEALDGITETIGVAPHEIDRVTLFWPVLTQPIIVVTTREPYNEVRVLKALKAEPVSDDDRGRWQHDGGGRISPTFKKSSTSQEFGPKRTNSDPAPDPMPPKLDLPRPPVPNLTPSDGDSSLEFCAATFAAGRRAAGGPAETLVYELPRGPFSLLLLVDERTLVFLPDDHQHGLGPLVLVAQLMQKKPTGPLAEALATASGHTLAAGVYLPPLFRDFDRKLPPDIAPYAALTAARTAVVTGDLGKSAKLALTLSFDDAATARRAGPVLEEGLKALAEKAGEAATEMKDARRPLEKALAPLMSAAAAGLKTAAVKTAGATVVATGEVDAGPTAAKAAAELIQSIASQKKFIERTNHLKQMGLAIHNYEAATGKLPTNVYNAKGEAILSWRVLLLPYLEHDNLSRQFKMDEPWDGPNNKKLIEQMPKVYETPERDGPKGKTFFQAFVGPDPKKPQRKDAPPRRPWFVEGDKTAMSLSSIPDGTANTFAVVEARDAVVWSKPDDIAFGEKIPPLGDEGADKFMALMFDGSVRAVRADTPAATLRALITINGGEVVPDDDDRPRRPREGVKPTGARRLESDHRPR